MERPRELDAKAYYGVDRWKNNSVGTMDPYADYNSSSPLLSVLGGQEAVSTLVLDSDGFRLQRYYRFLRTLDHLADTTLINSNE